MSNGGFGADEPLELGGHIVVPDDASALEADRLALLDELKDRASGATARPASGSSPQPQFWPYLLVFSALVLSLIGLVIVFLPQGGRPPAATALGAPLANAIAGQPGGLMPLGTVRVGLFDRELRDFRPGVIAVLPAGPCPTCEATIASVWEQEAAFQLRLLIVGSAAHGAQLGTLSAAAGGSATAIDNTDLLPQPAWGQLTLYLVHADGIIEAVVSARPGTQLEPVLHNLAQPGSAAS